MKILLVKLSSLGDVIASSPLPRLIRELSKNNIVDHFVMEHCAEITKYNPYVNKQIVVPFIPSGSRIKDIFAAYKILKEIRQNKYDKAFIFHRSALIALLLKLSGIKEVYGFESPINSLLNGFINYRTNINRTLLEVELLRLGGLPIQNPDNLEFYPDPKIILPHNFIPFRKFISCNPGGGNKHAPADNRIWPINNYIETIRRLNFPVVILGSGSSDYEKAEAIVRVIPEKVINLVGKTSFSETAEIIRRSELYLGNDSSLSFLAAAMGTKSVTLFGPTQVSAALPIGSKQYFINSTTHCSPCYVPSHGVNGSMYTCKNNICMQSIPASAVVKRIQQLTTS